MSFYQPPIPYAPIPEPYSIKSTKCSQCQVDNLFWGWNFRLKRPYLVDENRDPHECEIDIKEGNCHYCKAPELFWIRKAKKFELTEAYGLPHQCAEFRAFVADAREAVRMNYAFEKQRMKSIPDDLVCPSCDGKKWARKHKRWRNGNELMLVCFSCHGLGTYSVVAKKDYLGRLRRKYWPYKPHFKWNPK